MTPACRCRKGRAVEGKPHKHSVSLPPQPGPRASPRFAFPSSSAGSSRQPPVRFPLFLSRVLAPAPGSLSPLPQPGPRASPRFAFPSSSAGSWRQPPVRFPLFLSRVLAPAPGSEPSLTPSLGYPRCQRSTDAGSWVAQQRGERVAKTKPADKKTATAKCFTAAGEVGSFCNLIRLYWISLSLAKVHSARCSFVFANSSNLAFRSATSLVTLNSQLVAEVSVLMSLTPSILVKSPRTEAAHPPHVMLGTLSLT